MSVTNLSQTHAHSNLAIFGYAICINNGLYSLNDLHKASGNNPKHKPNNFLRLDTTRDLISEIEKENNTSSNMRSFSDVRSIALNVKNGVGTFVCKELVYSYAMWISAKFSLTVIRAFDAMTNKSSNIPSSVDDRVPLKDAVNKLVAVAHITYSDAWIMVHQRFSVASVEDLTIAQLPEAIAYVHKLTLQTAPSIDIEDLQTMAMWRHVGYLKYHEQAQKLRKLETAIYNCSSILESAQKTQGLLYDALVEGYRVSLPLELMKQSIKKAELVCR